MKKLVVASKNQGKIKEFQKMLSDLAFTVVSLEQYPGLDEPVETGATFMDNACLKASYYAKNTGEICLADDSGLEVYALNNAPGVLSARYAGKHGSDKENNLLLLKNMRHESDRRCRFFCALALAGVNGEILIKAEGNCEGKLLYEEKGQSGFGYDPLFYSLDLDKTLAEATNEEKNSVSHRSRALAQLVKRIGENHADWDNR